MKQPRFMHWVILCLTLVAMVINLPKQLPVKLKLGPLNIDRVIKAPTINLSWGPLNIRKDFSTRLGLDLSGGTHLVLEGDFSGITSDDRSRAFASSVQVVERRVNLFGLTEPVVQQSKVGDSYRIIVEIPGVSNVDEAVSLVGKTAQLSFWEEASESGKVATPSSYRELYPVQTNLTGKNLKKADVSFDPKTGKPAVSLEFDQEGAKIFEQLTTHSIGKNIAMFLDEELLSAPSVDEPIAGGNAIIKGNFTTAEAKRLSIALNAGALPVPLKVVEQRHIGATLGNESIQKSLLAGTIGLSVVAIFMIINYGFLGLVADVALVTYTLVTFALFKTIPVTLTLAGIAGFILSVGMAVDANILIFERMKEEMRWGKDRIYALKLGFDRAFPSIRDSNISSLITCAILYWFGTGIVRGFAITLAVGIIVSLFSAITVTRTLLRLVFNN